MAQSKVDDALVSPVVQQVITDLSIQDTVHDFWDGGRGEANPITDDSLRGFRDTITTMSTKLVNKNITDITLGEITKRADGNWINKPSNYERSLILKYEDKYPSHLFSKTKESITYKQIFTDYTTPGNPLKTRYLNSRGFRNVLSINTDPNEYFDSFTLQEKNIIANFILTFMFAQPTTQDVGKGPYGITYDAGPVAPRKVFADIEQMYNYIYPQNITDSAATSFKSKKIQFIFPEDSVGSGVSTVKSNRFTQAEVGIAFMNRGYSALNRYAFNWRFTYLPTNSFIDIPFGPGQSDGPSVNYLVTSVLNKGPVNGVREKGTIVDISPIQSVYDKYPGIIFDLKRTGDFEQVHASLHNPEAIFATIDHLCSFYARMLHKPCIWSNNASSEIVMYRFDVGEVDPMENAKREAVFFAQEQINRLKLLASIQTASEDIQKTVAEFERGKTAYYVTLSKASNLQAVLGFINTPAGYIPDTIDKQGYIADALTTGFLRAKCLDTLVFLDTLVKSVQSFQPSRTPGEYERFGALMNEMVLNSKDILVTPTAAGGYTISYNGVQQIETSIAALKVELETLRPVLDLQLTNEPFYKPLFEPNGTYNHKASNSLFDFSSGHFKSIHTAFRALIGIAFTGRSGRDRDKKVFNFLTEYFTARDTLLGTFRNNDFAENVRKQTDILVNDLTVSEAAIPTLGQRAIEMAQRSIGMVPPTTRGGRKTRRSKGGVRTRRSKGGVKATKPGREVDNSIAGLFGSKKPDSYPDENVSPKKKPSTVAIGQTMDLDLLFQDICGKAAAFVEAVVSETIASKHGIPGDGVDAPVPQADMYRVLGIPLASEILRDISIQWETELLRIREDGLDNYGFPYVQTQSEQFVTMLLSMDILNGVPDFYPYLNDTPILPRERPEYQDFFGALLLSPVFTARNLIVLTIFDNMMSGKNKQMKYFKHLTPKLDQEFKYGAPMEWDRLSQNLKSVIDIVNSYSLSREVQGLFGGGERKPLYSTTP